MDDDGIASPGQPIRQGDFLVNKQTPLIAMGQRSAEILADRCTWFSPGSIHIHGANSLPKAKAYGHRQDVHMWS